MREITNNTTTKYRVERWPVDQSKAKEALVRTRFGLLAWAPAGNPVAVGRSARFDSPEEARGTIAPDSEYRLVVLNVQD